MVTKTKKQSGAKGKKGKIKVLNLNKETVKNLTDDEAKGVKGGTTQCIIGSGLRLSGIRQTDSVLRQTSDSGTSFT